MIGMWRVLNKQSNFKEYQCPRFKLRNSRKKNKKRENRRRKPFSTLFTMMSIVSRMLKIQRTRTPLTLFAHISNKVFAKKERSAFTLTISLWIELKKSTCMLTKEHNWSWTQSEVKNWVLCLRKNWERWLEKNKRR